MSVAADRIIAVSTGKTVYKDGDSVIKLFCRPYTKVSVMHEAFNQAQFEAAGLSVPRIQEIFPSSGGWAIRYEYAHGKTMARLIEEQSEATQALLMQLIGIQRRIAACNAPLLSPLTDKLHREITLGISDPAQRAKLYAMLYRLPDGNAACHGALAPRDVIIAEDGTFSVLGWANAARGNYIFDVADTYLQLLLDESDSSSKLSMRYLKLFSANDTVLERCVTDFLPICAAARFGRASERERDVLSGFIPK